jgi:hypothetical protein
MSVLRRSRRSITVAAVILAAGAVSTSAAAPAAPWATVNVCDTARHPDTVGMRGSMPGSRASEGLFVRLRVQYLDTASNRWRYVGARADSGYISVGNGKATRRQGGRNFTLRPPASGGYVLRGIVDFQWRRGSAVVRRAQRQTRRGHPGTPGADPSSYSAETCKVS